MVQSPTRNAYEPIAFKIEKNTGHDGHMLELSSIKAWHKHDRDMSSESSCLPALCFCQYTFIPWNSEIWNASCMAPEIKT